MPFVRLPGGNVAHVRMSKRPAKRCKMCNRLTSERWQLLCDFVLPSGKTCDLLMCTVCAQATGPETDLCPKHALESKPKTGELR